MTERMSATEARVHFGALLRRVAEQNETVVVERAGQPRAVVLSVQEYQRLRDLEANALPWQTQVRVLRERLQASYGSRSLPPSEAIIRRMREERGLDAPDLP